MARRKRKEDDVAWEPPEFDEVGYMRQEIQNAKIATVVIAWAVVGAIIAYLVALWIPIVGYLVGLAAFGALYVLLPMLGLPIHGFKRRDWMSHASVYFFSWLAVSIVLLNAPFGDHTYPVVGSFEVGSFKPAANMTLPTANTTYCVPATAGGSASISVAPGNTSFYVKFRATDNVQVTTLNVTESDTTGTHYPSIIGIGNQPNACNAKLGLPPDPANTYAVVFPTGQNNIVVSVTAVDSSGLTTTVSITLLPTA